MAEPGRNLLEDEDEDEKPKGRNLLGITPAQPEPAQAMPTPAETMQRANETVRQIQDIEAADLDVRKGPFDSVVRDPANNPIIIGQNDPIAGKGYVDPRTYDPDATYRDYMDFSDASQQVPILMQRGATVGAGDELLSLMAPIMGENGGEFRDTVNKYYDQAYSDNWLGSMLLEAGGGVPTGSGMARLMSGAGMGPRGIAATEGVVYGFNDPMMGGDGLGSRALNAVGGGVLGNAAGAIGKGTKNQVDRQANVWSGADTIQRVAEEDFGITLTEGQIKGDPSLVSRENLAKKGALGDESANRAGREFFQDQNEAATRAARALGGDRYSEANQAAGEAADRIRGRISQKQDEITQAYDRAASFGAEMKPEGVAGLSNSIAGRLNNLDAQKIAELDAGIAEVSLFPALKSAVGSVRRMSENAATAGGPVRFQAIEDQRKYINQLINSAKNPEDKAAVVRFKKAFDQSIDAAVEDALFIGDDAFITAYKDARALNAQFQQEWGANKVFEKIVEREARPEEVVNFVLGGSRIAGDRNYDVLLQLKGALKEDPEAWQALQEAYVKKTFDQLPKDFGPQRTLKLLDDMLVGRNQGFAQVLFDDDQYQQLRRFRSVVESMVPPDGSINHSNTAVLVNRMRTSANDMLTGLHATPGMRAIGRTIMGAVDKIGVKTEGRRVKSQLNPPKGLDTRRIEQGFPKGRFGVPQAQLPSGRQPRTLQEGVDSVASQPAPDPVAPGPTPAPQRPTFGKRQPAPEVDPIAEAMNVPDENGMLPPSIGRPDGTLVPRPPRTAEQDAYSRMTKPKEPTTLTSAVRNMGGIKTRYGNFQENLSRGEFEVVPGLVNDKTGKSADDMVRALQEDGFDIVDENDLYAALNNERAGQKTYRIGEGEAYDMELDSWNSYIDQGDDPVSNGIPALKLRNRSTEGIKETRNSKEARHPRLLADGTPTVHYKVHQMVNEGMTRQEIAEEMEMSENAVSVAASQLRNAGYDITFARSSSSIGYSGEKSAMAVELKRQGLGTDEILARVNAAYGKDAVHGGTDMTKNSLFSLLSKSRRKVRESGGVVDFGIGVMPLGAAAGMNALPGDEQSIPEHMLNESGTIDEQLLRAMMMGAT